MNNPNIKHKRIPDDEFNAIRADVLKQWPTGREVDLKEAIEYHKAMPAHKVFSKKLFITIFRSLHLCLILLLHITQFRFHVYSFYVFFTFAG